MFRAWRRAGLTRRLAKRRIDQGSGLSTSVSGDSTGVTPDTANLLCSVVGLFDDHQLEILTEAVEMGYADGRTLDCIAATEINGWSSLSMPPNVACCRLWRWPTLDGSETIKPMPWCRCYMDQDNHCIKSHQNCLRCCCNPFHWSRLHLPDSPPPPYTAGIQEEELPELISNEDSTSWQQKVSSPASKTAQGNLEIDRLTGDDFLTSDDSSTEGDVNSSTWCHISYWEMRMRVGRQLFVSTDWTNIFQDLPHGDGISLAVLQQQNSTAPGTNWSNVASSVTDVSIKRTRAKIGRGIVLSREQDGVWIYNCSDYPVFINSPLCSVSACVSDVSLLIRRIPAGTATLVLGRFSSETVPVSAGDAGRSTDSCHKCHSIQVSFAKGWGRNYSRQSIMACPCWIEIHVNHRHHYPVT